jgi:pyruvate,water dikinase
MEDVSHTEQVTSLPINGVGVLTADTVIKSYGVHPKKILHDKKVQEYSSFLAKEIGLIAKSVYPKLLLFALSSGSTDMYRKLHGGKDLEPLHEKNPIIGYRGSYRHISDPRMLELELSVIKSVRAFGYNNVHIRIPFVRSVRELEVMKQCVHKAGFRRSTTCTIWMTCATPANALEIDDYLRCGLDGVFIDADTLSQLITGYDRYNSEVAPGLNDLDPALLTTYQQIITRCKKKKVPVIFNGSHITLTHDLIEKLVEWSVDFISVLPDAVHHTRERVMRAESKLASES